MSTARELRRLRADVRALSRALLTNWCAAFHRDDRRPIRPRVQLVSFAAGDGGWDDWLADVEPAPPFDANHHADPFAFGPDERATLAKLRRRCLTLLARRARHDLALVAKYRRAERSPRR